MDANKTFTPASNIAQPTSNKARRPEYTRLFYLLTFPLQGYVVLRSTTTLHQATLAAVLPYADLGSLVIFSTKGAVRSAVGAFLALMREKMGPSPPCRYDTNTAMALMTPKRSAMIPTPYIGPRVRTSSSSLSSSCMSSLTGIAER